VIYCIGTGEEKTSGFLSGLAGTKLRDLYLDTHWSKVDTTPQTFDDVEEPSIVYDAPRNVEKNLQV
jgi:hypothetical protein